MSFVKGLKCRECGHGLPVAPTHVVRDFVSGRWRWITIMSEIAKSISREEDRKPSPNHVALPGASPYRR